MVAACLYVGCRKESASRTHKEISQTFDIPKEKLTKCFKVLDKVLAIKMQPVPIGELVARLCHSVGMKTEKHIEACRTVAGILNDEQQGRNPNSITAASVCLVAREVAPEVKLSDICSQAGITEGTVSAVLKAQSIDVKGLLRKDVKK
eukprot:c5986_g1_i2.p1 GENE.c5986_g1_i2~~c5986_g1_i2.p1  ORF type:complete len:148 (-),score=28.19 c5986_g1_i2:16-459(-)